MEITVKHEFTMSPELASFFSRIMAPMHTETTSTTTVNDRQKAIAFSRASDKNEFLNDEVKAEQKLTIETSVPATETVKETTTSVSLEMVRAAVSEKANAKPGNRDKLKQLLTSFDAKNVTELDKAKYAEFLTAVNAL